MYSPQKEPPQTAPSALVFSLGTLPSLRPPSNQRLASRELSPQQLAVHERLKAERVGSAPLAGTPNTDRSSIDYQLERLKSRRLERDRELFGDGDSKPQSRESMPTSPGSSAMFPPPHSVSPARGRIEDAEGAFPTPSEAAAVTSKRPVAVSAATLKRRLALEKKEQAAKEGGADSATPAKTGGVPARHGGAGLRGKLGARGPAALPRPSSPPPEQERLKMLEATLQLMQCKGPIAKSVIAQAVAQEDSGPKAKKDAPKDPHSFDWMCQDKAIQDLNNNFLQRWILQDDFQQEAQYQERLKGASKPSEDTASSGMLSAVKTPLRGTRPAAVAQFPPFSVVAAIECNQLFKSFRSKILCRGDEESEAPTAPSPGQGSKDTVMTAEKVGRLRKAFPDLTLNSQGEQCYSPCDREIQLLWLSVTPIVRAIAVCMDNGRSTVSKAATEALSATLNCLGCMRLQSLIGSSADSSARIEALLAQPSSRAMDAQADAIITRLITKGGTASVKFLYDTCGLALMCAIRGMGATNKVLNTVLLTSVAQNPPKTEKSRVLWADSIAFALLLRWSYLHASHATKTGNPDDAVAVVNLVAHVLGSMDVARIAAGVSPLGSTQNLSSGIPEGKLPPPIRVVAAAVRDEATTAPPDQSPQPPNTSGRDMKDIATKLSVVADILLADGSPEVRESAKRVLFGYVLLAEEHALIYGYPPMGVDGSAPSPSKGGAAAGLDDTQSIASQVIPPTLESVAKRSFMDKKSKLDRILETMRLVRQVYADQFVPAVINRSVLSSPPIGSSRSASSSSRLSSRSSRSHSSSSSRSASSRSSSRRSSSSAPVTPVRAPKVEITPASTTKSKKRPEDAPPATPNKSQPSPAKSEGKVVDEKPPKSPNTRSKSPIPAKADIDSATSAIPHHPRTPSEKKGPQRPSRKVSTPSASPSAPRSATSPTPPLPPKSPRKSSSRPTSSNPVIAVGGDVVLTVPSGKPPKSSPSKPPRSKSRSPGEDDDDAKEKSPNPKSSKHKKATLDVDDEEEEDVSSSSGGSKLYVRPTRFADSLPPSVSRSDAELLFRSGVFVGASHSSRESSRSSAPASQFISIQMAAPSYSAWEKAFLVARNAIRAEGILFIPEVHEINKSLLLKAISDEKLEVKEGESELYHHSAATKAQSEESGAVTVSSSFSVTSLARRWSTGIVNTPKGLSIVPVASEDSQKQSRPEDLLTITDLIRCVACISHIPSSTIMNSSVALSGTISSPADRQDSREAALEFLRLALLCPGIEVSSHPNKTFASLPASLPYDVSVALLEALLQRCSSEPRGSKAQLTSLFVLHTLLDDIKRAKITVLDGWTAFAPSKERRKSVAPLTTSLGFSLSKPALDALSSKAIGALTTAISNTRPIGARGKAAPAAGPASVVACECLGIFLSVLNRFVYESAEEARMGLVLGGPSADLKKVQSLSLTTAKTLLNSVSMTASSTRCWSAKPVMINGMRELTLLFLAAEKRSATSKGASTTHNGRLSVISDKTLKDSSLLGDSDGTFMLAATPRSARLMPVSPMPTTSPFLSAVDVTRAFDTAVRVCSQALELLAGGSVGEDSEVVQAAVISSWSYMKAAFVCRQDDSESKASPVSSGSPGPTAVGSSSLLTATYANDLWNSNIAPYLLVAGVEGGGDTKRGQKKKSSRRLSLEDYEEDFEDSVKKGGSPPTGPPPVTPLPEKLIRELAERFETMRNSVVTVDMSASTSQSKRSKQKSENSSEAPDQRICDLIFCA